MNLSLNTLNRITTLVTKILADHGTEIAEILQALAIKPAATPTPPPVPVPLPAPATSLPEGFDEVFYLAMYPDVANAIRKGGPGAPTSGADHYIRHGASEGRQYRPSIVTGTVPPVTTTPTPAPTWEPRGAYSSSQALVADLTAHGFDTAVTVDGRQVYSGFGPAMRYYMWRDGTVRQEDSGQIPLPLDEPKQPTDGEIINLNP